jgi:hydrogenase nickel incorporation protein HypA/HybF
MHELALSRAILDTAIERAEGRRVTQVSVTIGALRQVVPGSLAFYFEIVSRGTLCDGASLQARLRPARVRCACGEEWELAEVSFHCPRCAGGQVTVLDGDELLVDSIEVEEVPCTAPR